MITDRIEEHYRRAFREICSEEDYKPRFRNHEIPATASLKNAIDYTWSYVIESKPFGTLHYRYNRYRRAVQHALSQNDNPIRFIIPGFPGNKIIHLDLGCGPGLFSWVVHDYLATMEWRQQNVEYIGYDHAENMIRLGRLFQEYLSVETYVFDGYSEIDRMLKEMQERDLSGHDCIVTLGYVLVQAGNDGSALGDFARAIKSLHPWKSCILVAVDAKSKQWVFDRNFKCLREVLEWSTGIKVCSCNRVPEESTAYAVLA